MNSKENSKTKKGISLIVLVITIIVIIILTSAVILSLSQNNPISSATEATFKQNLGEYKSELSLYITSEYAKNNGNFDPTTLNATDKTSLKTIISSIKDEDTSKFNVVYGQLVYLDSISDTEKSWAQAVGINPKSSSEKIVSTKSEKNKTFEGATSDFTYNNPVIPAGFTAVDTDMAKWENLSTDWNNGLVIQDVSGNQFVWVPVDGTNVTYTKWCTAGISYTSTDLVNDTFPENLDEVVLENKYQGFYIGRYEAVFDYNNGNPRIREKKSSNLSTSLWTRDSEHTGYLWNFINYTDSKSYAESMDTSYGYDTTRIGTNLVTDTEWDTTLKWIQNSGLNVSTDSTEWGNYSNASFIYTYPNIGNKTANTSVLLNTGATKRNSAKNIYDLAGNVWEWINEKYSAAYVFRGGYYDHSGTINPATYRSFYDASGSDKVLGLRTSLYIK